VLSTGITEINFVVLSVNDDDDEIPIYYQHSIMLKHEKLPVVKHNP